MKSTGPGCVCVSGVTDMSGVGLVSGVAANTILVHCWHVPHTCVCSAHDSMGGLGNLLQRRVMHQAFLQAAVTLVLSTAQLAEQRWCNITSCGSIQSMLRNTIDSKSQLQ